MANATIRDVARQAQVSVASVSRVLNGRAPVSEQTRASVEAAVKALGYVPHAGRQGGQVPAVAANGQQVHAVAGIRDAGGQIQQHALDSAGAGEGRKNGNPARIHARAAGSGRPSAAR